MNELTWLMVGVWVIMIVLFAVFKKTIYGGAGGAVGAFFALMVLSDSIPLGFILLVFNIYLLYAALVKGGKGEK